MVAEQGDQCALAAEFNESVDDSATIRAAVDVVPNCDDHISRSGRHQAQETVQRQGMSVYVTDGDESIQQLSCFVIWERHAGVAGFFRS